MWRFVFGGLLRRERTNWRCLVKPDPFVELPGERRIKIMTESFRFRVIDHADRAFQPPGRSADINCLFLGLESGRKKASISARCITRS